MAVPQDKLYMTVEEYLEFEKTSDVRHEYVDGAIYAMAGESKRHNRIGGNIYAALLRHLGDGDCDVYFEAVKVYTSTTKYYYPDVVVICQDTSEDDYSLSNPHLIIEVLSPLTERIDRAEKLIAYQKQASLQEYVIVAQDRIWVQIHRRQSNDNWAVENYFDLNDEVTFASVNFTTNISEIYRNINFPAPESSETEL